MTVTDEDVEAVADVIDPHIRGIIADYCAKKGYTATETAEEFAKSGRWQQAKEKARECLQAYASRKGDFGASSVETATKILVNLGFKTDPSLEPGADRRRDRIARFIEDAHPPSADAEGQSPPEPGWNEAIEGLQAELRGGLNVTDEELLRIRNECEGNDHEMRIWARMLQELVDHIRRLRALAKKPEATQP
jgi:hypothetical protein